MGDWVYHWLWMDVYVPVWPNIVASIICAAWVVAKVRALRKLHERHNSALHVRINTLHEHVRGLHDKFDAQAPDSQLPRTSEQLPVVVPAEREHPA